MVDIALHFFEKCRVVLSKTNQDIWWEFGPLLPYDGQSKACWLEQSVNDARSSNNSDKISIYCGNDSQSFRILNHPIDQGISQNWEAFSVVPNP